jgi:4-hydroxyphenylpyruvate dioxygenase-like putative hemolysin
VKEDLERLQKLRILVDYDDEGYLLQVYFFFLLDGLPR